MLFHLAGVKYLPVLTFESKITSIYKAYMPDPNFLFKL